MPPPVDPPRTWLVCIAAPKEVDAAIRVLNMQTLVPTTPNIWEITAAPGAEILPTGVGKAAAAAATAHWFDPERHAGVLNIGIAGALPRSGLEIGDAVLAVPSIFADEGTLTPDGFLTLDAMGFGRDAPDLLPDDATRTALTPLIDRVGPVATVSVCSGADAWAAETARRTGAIAEAMEGAAIALAARRIDPAARFAELRVISNTTGDRHRQTWDLARALDRMAILLPEALRALTAR